MVAGIGLLAVQAGLVEEVLYRPFVIPGVAILATALATELNRHVSCRVALLMLPGLLQ